ncbi:sporulation protein YpjB [Thalassobacillus pellis]|uniref:sporulation protein YpjB n=1 Tax=Thalassobacillus pellis TaxID=748008 RepID=UPI001960A325|nr:sporulation protein YpjB [Thalassobacillus pellis]MBM7552480.1 hypothetical protein [Thalassobacillus pellis]
MLRRITILMLVFLFMVSWHRVEAKPVPGYLTQFVEEYYSAVKDGDLTLSYNLLRYNEKGLEEYIQEHQPMYMEKFLELKNKIVRQKGSLKGKTGTGHSQMVLLLDVLIHEDARYFQHEKNRLAEVIDQYHNSIVPSASLDVTSIISNWEIMLPAAEIVFTKEVYDQFETYYQMLVKSDTPAEIERTLSLSLELMSKNAPDSKVFELDALLWTIIIVGGCIIVTLSYVGYKKYQAEKQKALYKKLNS